MSVLKNSCLDILKKNRLSLENMGTFGVGLFGSFARDENSSKSDFDIIAYVDSIQNEDIVSKYIKNILKPLGREVDVNFPTNIGIGNRFWANIERDSIMAFGELPKAVSRMEKLNMNHEKSDLVILELANRFPKFDRFFKFELDRYKDSPEANKGIALRISQRVVREFDHSVKDDFFKKFDEVALDILGYNTVRIHPEKPGEDPRKRKFERE